MLWWIKVIEKGMPKKLLFRAVLKKYTLLVILKI